MAPPGPEPPLTIDVRYLFAMTPQQRAVFDAAVGKWTRALFKDFGDFRFVSAANDCFQGQPQLNETHHNPLLFVSLEEVDGPGRIGAYTELCTFSERDTLPILTHIRFDRADFESLEADGLLADLYIHEIGHALGFNPDSYMPRRLGGGGTSDPHFSGVAARAEFAKHGAWYTGLTVPLEDRSEAGPYDAHWRFSVFGDELMVAVVGQDFKSPLSVITLGLFKDLGYEVDFSAADPYQVQPISSANRLRPQIMLANDLRRTAAPTVLNPLAVH